MREAVERYYDAVLVYGPPWTPDALDALGWRDLPAAGAPRRLRRPPGASDAGRGDLPDDYLLVTAGGGADGFACCSRPLLDAVR